MGIIDKIGLAVTGCKNGYAIFGTAGAADRNSQEAKRALRDMRSYMRVSEPGKTCYSMEYLDSAIVYGIYRSSIDSVGSTGAYIAVHLFVPYDIAVSALTTVLDTLLHTYWDEFMHPMFGSPLPGKIEDVSRVWRALEGMAGYFREIHARYGHANSDPAQPPVFIGYRSAQEVDAVTSNPFHQAYYGSARVIMVPAEMLDNPQAHNTIFNTELRRVLPQHGHAEGLIGGLTVPPSANVRLTTLSVDGHDIFTSGEDYTLMPESRLRFQLKIPGRRINTFEGTVRQALDRKCIRKAGSGYEIMPVLVEVDAAVTGTMRPDCLPVLISAAGKEYRIKNLPSGKAGWLVPSDGFPFALGVFTPSGTEKVKDNFVTLTTFSSTAYPVDMHALANAVNANRPPAMPQEEEVLVEKRNNLIIIIAGILLLALLGFGAWWFFFRDEEKPAEPAKAHAAVYPDSTRLVIDAALLPADGSVWEVSFDSLPGVPASAAEYRKGQPLVIILRNKRWTKDCKNLTAPLKLIFTDPKSGKQTGRLDITREMVDSMDNLLLFPKNTISEFRVRSLKEAREEETLVEEAMGNTPTRRVNSIPAEPANFSEVEKIPQDNPDEASLTPEQKKERERIRRAKLREEVKTVISQLNSAPTPEAYSHGQALLKEVENGQKPALTTALKKAEPTLRQQQQQQKQKTRKN